MGGLFSRNKGKRGEREVVKVLQPSIDLVYNEFGVEPPQLLRNQMQSAVGGFDIVGIEWMALEVKFCEQLQLSQWWVQTTRQASAGQTPTLFYRKSHCKWRVKFEAKVNHGRKIVVIPVDVEIGHFIQFFQMRLRLELAERFSAPLV